MIFNKSFSLPKTSCYVKKIITTTTTTVAATTIKNPPLDVYGYRHYLTKLKNNTTII